MEKWQVKIPKAQGVILLFLSFALLYNENMKLSKVAHTMYKTKHNIIACKGVGIDWKRYLI